jgi:hypothetical protein
MARKGFDISGEYMTQTIYENYLGIFRVMEIWVASQPKTDRVIPLIEKKEYSQEKEYWVWSKMEMTWSWDDLRLASHLGEESKVISTGFMTTKPQKSKTRPKLKEKESGQNPGCYSEDAEEVRRLCSDARRESLEEPVPVHVGEGDKGSPRNSRRPRFFFQRRTR